MHRRSFLKASLATAVAPLIPTVVAAAPVVMPPPNALNALYPVWAVGTDYGRDWKLLRAPTLKDAIAAWRSETGGGCDCDCGDPEDREECCVYCGNPSGHRVKALDDSLEITSRNEAAQIAGWMNTCQRCNWDEVDPSDYYVLAKDECVCQECMTLADWKTEDPERYAELVDEILTYEYGPDLNHPEYW